MTEAINPRNRSISLSEPKNATSYSTSRNVAITTFVVGLLGAIATILLWQLGGTCNWVTYTVGGVSGALLIGAAIAAMISYNNKSGQKPSSRSTTSATISKTGAQSTSAGVSKAPISKAAHVKVEPPPAPQVPKGPPSAKELKAKHQTPLGHDPKESVSYLGQAINAGDMRLLEEYLTEFTWTIELSANSDHCMIDAAYKYLLPTTPQPIIARFSQKLHELIKPDLREKELTIPLPTNGVVLVTEEMLMEGIRSSHPRNFEQLLIGYPRECPDFGFYLSIHTKAIEAHARWWKQVEIEKMCREGTNLESITSLLRHYKIAPREKFKGLVGSVAALPLLIQSGKVEIIKEFIRTQQVMITLEDIDLAKTKGLAEVVTLLETTAKEQQAKKNTDFDRIAEMITGGGYRTDQLHEEVNRACIRRNEEAVEGPYKGKTLLQIAVEYNTKYVEVLTHGSYVDRGTHMSLRLSKFFLGNASDENLGHLAKLDVMTLDQLKAKREQDQTRLKAFGECQGLVRMPENNGKVLELMREHGFEPDTVFPGMRLDKSLLRCASYAWGRELLKTFVIMLNGKDVIMTTKIYRDYQHVDTRIENFADCAQIHEDDVKDPESGEASLLQRSVEANALVLVKKIVEAHFKGAKPYSFYKDHYTQINTSKFFLADCSDEVLAELAKISVESIDVLKAKRAKDAIIAPLAKLAVDDKNKDAVLKQLAELRLTPDVYCGRKKTLIEVVALAGKPALETLKALVVQLNGRKVISSRVFERYTSQLESKLLEPDSAAQLKLVVQEDAPANKADGKSDT